MNHSAPPHRGWMLAAVLWVLVVLALCWWPADHLPLNQPFWSADKLVHAGIFAVLALLLRRTGMRSWLVLCVAVLLAIISELGQHLTRDWLHRAGDVADGSADIVGALLMLGALHLMQRRQAGLPARAGQPSAGPPAD